MLKPIQYQSNLDGTHITADYYAIEDSKALILIIHGMAEHRGRYAALAERLNMAGYDVLVPDQRGHGDSPVEGHYGYYGEKKGMERQLYDFIEILKLANEKQLPLYFLGHSMGTLWVRFIMKRYPNLAKKVLLSGTPAYQKGTQVVSPLVSGISSFSPQKPATWIARQMNDSFNKQVPNALTEFDWLSFDRDNIARYMQDPKCGFPFTLAGYAVLFDLMEEVYGGDPWTVNNPNLPIVFFSGTHDPVGKVASGGVSKALEDLRLKGYNNVGLRYFDRSRHEIYNDQEKDVVIQATIDFFNAD